MAHFGATVSHRAELRGTTALAAVAMLIGTAFGLSTLLTPLYLIYQQQLGFSQITLTLIYAAYALGNVAALLFFGRVSDRLGRRLAAMSAAVLLGISALVFLLGHGLAALYIARILSGLAIGIASGTGNAWLVELVGSDKTRAAMIGTSSNFIGLGLAPLASGLLAQYAPRPLELSFVVYLVVLALVAVLVWFTEETVQDRHPGRIEWRPNLALPRNIRAQFRNYRIRPDGAGRLLCGAHADHPVARSADQEPCRRSRRAVLRAGGGGRRCNRRHADLCKRHIDAVVAGADDPRGPGRLWQHGSRRRCG
jgi:MFS family permease